MGVDSAHTLFVHSSRGSACAKGPPSRKLDAGGTSRSFSHTASWRCLASRSCAVAASRSAAAAASRASRPSFSRVRYALSMASISSLCSLSCMRVYRLDLAAVRLHRMRALPCARAHLVRLPQRLQVLIEGALGGFCGEQRAIALLEAASVRRHLVVQRRLGLVHLRRHRGGDHVALEALDARGERANIAVGGGGCIACCGTQARVVATQAGDLVLEAALRLVAGL